MQQTCRLIIDGFGGNESCRTGPMNMAIDEVLLKTASERSQPTLRFYGWRSATLSLGYFQKLAERKQHAASQNCDIVRRASGGGAILHHRELTYSFAAPTTSRWGASELYLAFHETIIEVLKILGVEAGVHDPKDGLSDHAFLCFQRRASGDVTCLGSKIMGSAQRRAKKAVLQHGSLLLAKSEFSPELPGIQQITKLAVQSENVVQLWIPALSSRLKVSFSEGELADTENQDAVVLAERKFAAESWLQKR